MCFYALHHRNSESVYGILFINQSVIALTAENVYQHFQAAHQTESNPILAKVATVPALVIAARGAAAALACAVLRGIVVALVDSRNADLQGKRHFIFLIIFIKLQHWPKKEEFFVSISYSDHKWLFHADF